MVPKASDECSGGRDQEPLVLDFDVEALSGSEAGVFEPTARKLEPGHEGRFGTAVRLVGPLAAGFLDCDASRGRGVECFKIGVSHNRLRYELMVVSGSFGLPPMRPALRLRR